MPSQETATKTPSVRILAARVKTARAAYLRAIEDMDEYFNRSCCHEFSSKEEAERAWTKAHRAVTRAQNADAKAFESFVLAACEEYGIKP